MGRPKGSGKKAVAAVESADDTLDKIIEEAKERIGEEKPYSWPDPTRKEIVESLTREILLKKLEFKSGRGFAADVQDSREIAEAFADSFGYKD